MARITVNLSAAEREALRVQAERELRPMRDQARYLIVRGLAPDVARAAEQRTAQPEAEAAHARQQ